MDNKRVKRIRGINVTEMGMDFKDGYHLPLIDGYMVGYIDFFWGLMDKKIWCLNTPYFVRNSI